MDGWNKVSLENINHGAAVELFDDELQKCHVNILDPNTDRYAVREVKLTIRMRLDKQDPENKKIDYDIKAVSKLAPHLGASGSMYFGRENGEVVAFESSGKQPPLPGFETGKVFGIKTGTSGGQP